MGVGKGREMKELCLTETVVQSSLDEGAPRLILVVDPEWVGGVVFSSSYKLLTCLGLRA